MPTSPAAAHVLATDAAVASAPPCPDRAQCTHTTPLAALSWSTSSSCAVAGAHRGTPMHVTQRRTEQGTERHRVTTSVAGPRTDAQALAAGPLTSCISPSPPPPSVLLLLLLCFRKGLVPLLPPVALTLPPPTLTFRADRCPLWRRLWGAQQHGCVAAAASGVTSTATAAAAFCHASTPTSATAALQRAPLPRPSTLLISWRGSPRVELPALCRAYGTAAPPPPPFTPGAAAAPHSLLDLSDPTSGEEAVAYSRVSVVTTGSPWSREKEETAAARRGSRGKSATPPQRSNASSRPQFSPSSQSGSGPQRTSRNGERSTSRVDFRSAESDRDGGGGGAAAETGQRSRNAYRHRRHRSSDAGATSGGVQTTWRGESAQSRRAGRRPQHERTKPDADQPHREHQQHQQQCAATAAPSATEAMRTGATPSASDARNSSRGTGAKTSAAAPLSSLTPSVLEAAPGSGGAQGDAALRRLLAMHPTFASNYTTMQSDEKMATALERLCAKALAHSRVLEDVADAMSRDTPDATQPAAGATVRPSPVRLNLTSSSSPASVPPATLAVLEVSPAAVRWLDQVIALPPLSVHEIAGCLESLQHRAVAVAGAADVAGERPAGEAAQGAAAATSSGALHAVESARPVRDLWYHAWGRQRCARDDTACGTASTQENPATAATAAAPATERWQRTQSRLQGVLLAHFTGRGEGRRDGDAGNGRGSATRAVAPSSSRFRKADRASDASGSAEEALTTRPGLAADGDVRGLLPYLANLLATLSLVKRGRLARQFRADAARVAKADKSRGAASETTAPAGTYAHLCHVAQCAFAATHVQTLDFTAFAATRAAAELRVAAQQYLRSISPVDAVRPAVPSSGLDEAAALERSDRGAVPSYDVAVLDALIGLLLRVLVFYFPVLSSKMQHDLFTSLMEPWLRQRQELEENGRGEGTGGDTGGCPCAPAAWRALLSVETALQEVRPRGGADLVLFTLTVDGLEETMQHVQALCGLWQPTVLDAKARAVRRVLALPASGNTPGSPGEAARTAALLAEQRRPDQLPRWPDVVLILSSTCAQQFFVRKLVQLVFAALAAVTVPLNGVLTRSLQSIRLGWPSSQCPLNLDAVTASAEMLDSSVQAQLEWNHTPGVAARGSAADDGDELPAGTLRTLVQQHSTYPYATSRLLLRFLAPLVQPLDLLTGEHPSKRRMRLVDLVLRSVAPPVASVLQVMPPLPVQHGKPAGVHDSRSRSSGIVPDEVDTAAFVPPSAVRAWRAVAPLISLLRECALPVLWLILWFRVHARLRQLPSSASARMLKARSEGQADDSTRERLVGRLAELGAACAWLLVMAPEARRQAELRLSAGADSEATRALAVLRGAGVAEAFAQSVRDVLTVWTQLGEGAAAGELLLTHFKTKPSAAVVVAAAAAATAEAPVGGDAEGVSPAETAPRDGGEAGGASLNAAEWATLVELATAAQTCIWTPVLREEVAAWSHKAALVESVQAPGFSPAVQQPAVATAGAAAGVASPRPTVGSLEPVSNAAAAAAAAATTPTPPSAALPPSMDAALLRWWRVLTGADLGLAPAPVLLPEVWATLSRIVLARAPSQVGSGEVVFTAEEVLVVVRQLSRIASRSVVSILLEERVESSTPHAGAGESAGLRGAGRRTASTSDGSLIMESLRRVALHAEPPVAAAAAAGGAASSAAASATGTGGTGSGAQTEHAEERRTCAELVDRVEAALLGSLTVHLPRLPAMTVIEAALLRLCSLSTVSSLLLRHTHEDRDKGTAAAAATSSAELSRSTTNAPAGPAAAHTQTTSRPTDTAPARQLSGTLRDAPAAWLHALHDAVAANPHACHSASAFAHTFYRLLGQPWARGGPNALRAASPQASSAAALYEFVTQLHASCAEAVMAQYAGSTTAGAGAAAAAAAVLADTEAERTALASAVHASGVVVAATPAPPHDQAEACDGAASSALASPSSAAAGGESRDAATVSSLTTPREEHGRHYVHVRVLAAELHLRLLPVSVARHDALDDVWALYASLLKAAEALLAHADMGNVVDALQLVALVSTRLPLPQARAGSGSRRVATGAAVQEAGDAASERAVGAASAQATPAAAVHDGDDPQRTAAPVGSPPPSLAAVDVAVAALQLHDRFRRFVQRVMPHVDGLVVEQAKREAPRLFTVALLASTKSAVDTVLARDGGAEAATAAAPRTGFSASTSLFATERRTAPQHALWQRVPLATLLQRATHERLGSWLDAQLLWSLFATAPEVSTALPPAAWQLRDYHMQLPWSGVDTAFKAIAVVAADSQHRGEADVLRRDGDGATLLSCVASPASSAVGGGREARVQGAERARRAGGAVLLAVPASMAAGPVSVRVGELRPPTGDAVHTPTVPVFRSSAALHATRAPPSVLRQVWSAFAKRLLQDECDPALGDASMWVAALYSGAVTGCAGTQLFARLLASLVFGVNAATGAPRVDGLDMAGWTVLLQACAAPAGQRRHRPTHQSLLEDPFHQFVDRTTTRALEAAAARTGEGALAVSGPERCAFLEAIPLLFLADATAWIRVRRCVEAWVDALDAHHPVRASASSSTDVCRREWAAQWQRSFNWAVRSGGHGSLVFADSWRDASAATEGAAAVEWMQAELAPLVEVGDGSHSASR